MKILHKAPKGYRRLKANEIVKKGDLANYKGNRNLGHESMIDDGFIEALPHFWDEKAEHPALAFYRRIS